MRKFILILASFLICSTAVAENSDEYNFRFSPVGLIVGAIGIDFDIKVSDDWTVGPDVAYWHFVYGSGGTYKNNYDLLAYAFGVRANWFNNGAYTDGLYIGPSLKYVNARISVTDDAGNNLSGTLSGALAECLVGYGWFWSSFNMMLGGGLSSLIGSTNITLTNPSGTVNTVNPPLAGLSLEFSLGWTFSTALRPVGILSL